MDFFGSFCFFSAEWTVAALVCTIKTHCEVITIQKYCYALVSCHIFLLTDHAVGTRANCFWEIFRDSLPFFFSSALALQDTDVLLPMSTLQ